MVDENPLSDEPVPAQADARAHESVDEPAHEPAREPRSHHPHLHDAAGRLRDAAIQAEFDTGYREDTVEEAKASIFRRLARMTGGWIVVIIGIILMPLPGPGLVIVAAGLGILSRDFPWAERTLANVTRRIPRDQRGKIPRVTWVMMAATMTAGLTVSLWFSFLR